MDSSPAALPGSVTSTTDPICAWTIHAAPLDPRKLAVVAAVSVTIFGVALLLFHSLLVAVLATALLLAFSLSSRIPLSYALDDVGVKVRIGSFVWLEMNWAAVKCVSSVHRGLKLSAFENPTLSRLESRRGVRVRYPSALAEQVEAEIRRRRSA